MVVSKRTVAAAVKILLVTLLSLVFSSHVRAQVLITGTVVDTLSQYPLYPATVLDKTTGRSVYADSAGNYQIMVAPGDLLHFSYVGFYTQTYQVPLRLTRIIHNVFLMPRTQRLSEVRVNALTPYGKDSLDRATTFGDYLNAPKTRLMDREGDHAEGGFGVSFHPITYFSKAERNKRRFQKMFPNFENDAFIDSRYTPQLVTRLTGLTGDSLAQFLHQFRPAYDFTRAASDLEFWSWIKNQYKNWIRPK
jgi:hypothetical protein